MHTTFPTSQRQIIAHCNKQGLFNFEISKARNCFMIQTEHGCQNVQARSLSSLSLDQWHGLVKMACDGFFFSC